MEALHHLSQFLGSLFYFLYTLRRLTYTEEQDLNQVNRTLPKLIAVLANCFLLASPLAARRNESKMGRKGGKGGRAQEREEAWRGEGRPNGSSLARLKEVLPTDHAETLKSYS